MLFWDVSIWCRINPYFGKNIWLLIAVLLMSVERECSASVNTNRLFLHFQGLMRLHANTDFLDCFCQQSVKTVSCHFRNGVTWYLNLIPLVSQANYSIQHITFVLCINTLKHRSNESKMQNWYFVQLIKSLFSKLALPLRVWQRNFFTKLERRIKQRNWPFKKKFTL